ncbi:SEC-C metal-binding domain-containing protein [Aeromonas salmonicida]|uniref:SEC-C metal-binding domain-containing protein n=1 Tax=Aeromonas salmonicida TaxID=645 RepID=UPI0038BA4906
MKMKRNDKCWCNSGKKFKHCHYGRKDESPISKGEAIYFSKRNSQRKGCYVPEEMKSSCSNKIINAHTISKSGSLMAIADSSNHVFGLKIDLPNLIKNNGKLIPEKIGINQASTFKGFCSTHDKALFSCIEDKPFTGDDEQCFALMYRSVAKELYAKEGSLNNADFIKTGDKGKDVALQVLIQEFANENKSGVEIAITELSALKEKLDRHLLGNTNEDICHLIIKSSSPTPVVVSSIIAPSINFFGKQIQDLSNLNVKAEHVIINSLSSAGNGYFVLSWLDESKKIHNFIDSLLKDGASDVFNKLVKFSFCMAENTFFAPSWWGNLSISQQERIKKFIMSGVNPFTMEKEITYIDNDISFSGWDIQCIKNTKDTDTEH